MTGTGFVVADVEGSGVTGEVMVGTGVSGFKSNSYGKLQGFVRRGMVDTGQGGASGPEKF